MTGASHLYLNVRDGGDGNAWDHANWLAPTLSGGAKTRPLTDVPWQSTTAGWGQATLNKSVSSGPLQVAGQLSPTGIGTHANSLIAYKLPAGFIHLRTTVGLDQAGAVQDTGGTVQFLVFTRNPLLVPPPDSVQVLVALAELGLGAGCRVQELWSGRALGEFRGEFAPYVRRHGAGFYRLAARRPKP